MPAQLLRRLAAATAGAAAIVVSGARVAHTPTRPEGRPRTDGLTGGEDGHTDDHNGAHVNDSTS